MKNGFIINSKGQRAGNCIDFCWSGKFGNCQLYEDWQVNKHPCIVCKGGYCVNYRGKLINEV